MCRFMLILYASYVICVINSNFRTNKNIKPVIVRLHADGKYYFI